MIKSRLEEIHFVPNSTVFIWGIIRNKNTNLNIASLNVNSSQTITQMTIITTVIEPMSANLSSERLRGFPCPVSRISVFQN